MKPLILLALLFPVLTFAQVQKCTIDGKTVYSDSQCGQSGVAVNTDANSLDTSGLRDLAVKREQQEKAEREKQKAQMAKEARSKPSTDQCGNAIDLSHAPSARQKNEARRCQEKIVREYNRPSY